MDEGDRRALRAWARPVVDHAHPARPELIDSGVNVVDAQRDVVQSWTALVDIPGDCRFRGSRLEQLELRLPDGDEMRAHALTRHLLGWFDLQAQRVAVERQRRGQILNRDADVIEDGFHLTGWPRK